MSEGNLIPFPEQFSRKVVDRRGLEPPRIHLPGALSERVYVKDVTVTQTEADILRETARRLRWIGAGVTADVMEGIAERWDAA